MYLIFPYNCAICGEVGDIVSEVAPVKRFKLLVGKDTLTIETIPEKSGQKFAKWLDESGEEATVVTEDMVVTASYEDTKYTVIFKDWEGNVISEQEVSYGESADIPDDLEQPNEAQVFQTWDLYHEAKFVTRNMMVLPIATYINESEEPLFTLKSGTYKDEQKVGIYSLSSNVDIYYLVKDMTAAEEDYFASKDEQFSEYKKPITITESSVIFAYAVEKDSRSSSVSKLVIKISDEEDPTTEKPTVDDPTTEKPTVDDPTTEKPAIEDPITEKPTVDDPTTEKPAVEDPTTEKPAVDDPTTEKPATEDPTTEKPATEDPTTEKPAVDDPTTEKPAVDDPTTEKPAVDDPATEKPVTDDPTTEKPAVDDPTTEKPVTDDPTTEKPTNPDDKERKLKEIEIAKSKTQYKVHDVLTFDDLTVTAIYLDGTKKDLVSSDYTMLGFVDMSVPGIKTIKIKYEEGGISSSAELEIFVEEENEKPQVPDNISLKNISGGVQLSWEADIAADGYYIYRSIDGGRYKKIKTISEWSTSVYNDKSVTNGKKYQYKVSAYVENDVDVYETEMSLEKTIYHVSKPKLSSVVSSYGKKMTVKWKKNSQATGYELCYSTKSNFKDKKTVKVTSAKTTSKTVSKLKAKTKYYVKIRTYKTVGGKKYYSEWSAVKNVKTKK